MRPPFQTLLGKSIRFIAPINASWCSDLLKYGNSFAHALSYRYPNSLCRIVLPSLGKRLRSHSNCTVTTESNVNSTRRLASKSMASALSECATSLSTPSPVLMLVPYGVSRTHYDLSYDLLLLEQQIIRLWIHHQHHQQYQTAHAVHRAGKGEKGTRCLLDASQG